MQKWLTTAFVIFFFIVIGSDAQAASPQDWDAAYDAATCGAVISLDAGNYPEQDFDGNKTCVGNPVVFEANGTVTVQGGVSIQGADWLTLKGVTTSYAMVGSGKINQHGIWVGPGSTNITLDDIDAGSVDSWMAFNLNVLGGDYGPCYSTDNSICGNNKQDVSDNVLIDGAYFHDLELDPARPNDHWECMYLNGTLNNTVRNSTFERCAVFDIFVTISGPDAGARGHENLVLEGNTFYPATDGFGNETRGPASLQLAWCENAGQPSYRNISIRNNHFARGSSHVRDEVAGCQWQNVRFEGNTSAWPDGCHGQWIFNNNRWYPNWRNVNGVCSSTDVMIPSDDNTPPPPPPPPTTTTEPTTSETTPTTTTPTEPPPPYEPNCMPDCDSIIAALNSTIQGLQDTLAACSVRLKKVNSIYHSKKSQGNKLSDIHTELHRTGLCRVSD